METIANIPETGNIPVVAWPGDGPVLFCAAVEDSPPFAEGS